MICFDNSDYMRDGDFIPSRLQVQQDAVSLISHTKTRSNAENNVGLLTLTDGRVVTQLTNDVGKIFSKLHMVPMEGKVDFCKGVKVANLALKHRQGKQHRARIIAFVGSPLVIDENEFNRLAKRLKKEKISIDIVIFGEESSKEKFEQFISTVNGKDNTSSHLVCVPSGANLPDALVNTPIIQGEDGSGLPSGYSASSFSYGFNPEDDPELAMALRISMEEQRRVQEAEIGAPSNNKETSNQSKPETTGSVPVTQPANEEMDINRMTEEEQIELALRMSMAQDSNDVEMKEESATAQKETTTAEKEDNFAASLTDPQFLSNVIRDLPGVDIHSEAVQAALQQVQQQQPQTKSDNKQKDQSNPDTKKKD